MPSLLKSTRFLSLLLVVGFLLWLYMAGQGHRSWVVWWALFQTQWQHGQPGWLVLAVLLMPVNWGLEAHKWRLLLRGVYAVSFFQAVRGVLCGVSTSVFTPNRVGEFAGRVLLLPPGVRWAATAAHGMGMVSQLWVLLLAGGWGVGWLGERLFSIKTTWVAGWWIMWTVSLLVLLRVYGWLAGDYAHRLRIYRWWGQVVTGIYQRSWLCWPRLRPVLLWLKRLGENARQALHRVSPDMLWGVLGWAALRYGVYALQYFCLLQFTGIGVGWLDGFAGISTLFLLQAGLPLPVLPGMLARGGLAVQMWAFFGGHELSSLAATGMLWILNLILPALVGTFSLLHVPIHELHPDAHD